MKRSPVSRRQFLKFSGAAAGAWLLTACQRNLPAPTQDSAVSLPAPTRPFATPAFTSTPAFTATQTATHTPTETSTPTNTPIPPKAVVALERQADYNPAGLKNVLANMLDQAGKINWRGARVGIKPNLTGGAWWDTPDRPPAVEYFVTHPAVVQALAELALDGGASQVMIMEGLGDGRVFDLWGYSEIARPLNAQLVDLCQPDPYAGFARFPVSAKAGIYDLFYMNGLLNKVDVFISAAKMKCHTTTGVTLTMKNLFGIAPISEYRRDPSHNHRSAFHGSSDYDTRVPRVILDLNRARPVHLAVVDGIMTAEAGAGPWDSGMNQVKPGLLAAGLDAVAVDAVSCALMGFDPTAPGGARPFLYGDNHIDLAHQSGLGWGRLEEVDLGGKNLADYVFPFKAVE